MLHHSTVRDGVQISALVCKIFLSCHEMCMQKVGRSAVWTNDKSSYKTSSLFTGSRYWNGFNNWKVNIFLFLSIILRLFSVRHNIINLISCQNASLGYRTSDFLNTTGVKWVRRWWWWASCSLYWQSQINIYPLKNALTWLWQFIKSKSYQPHICQYYRFFSS